MHAQTNSYISRITYFERLLVVFGAFPINVMMRAYGLAQFRSDNHARALRGRTAGEEHDAASSVLE